MPRERLRLHVSGLPADVAEVPAVLRRSGPKVEAVAGQDDMAHAQVPHSKLVPLLLREIGLAVERICQLLVAQLLEPSRLLRSDILPPQAGGAQPTVDARVLLAGIVLGCGGLQRIREPLSRLERTGPPLGRRWRGGHERGGDGELGGGA
eukprot:6928159-Prymnesium_polylepis.2